MLEPTVGKRRIASEAGPRLQNPQDMSQQINKAEKGLGMAQVVQCLPGKCEALSSNPAVEKKRKT
jgi:hypothetical protein